MNTMDPACRRFVQSNQCTKQPAHTKYQNTTQQNAYKIFQNQLLIEQQKRQLVKLQQDLQAQVQAHLVSSLTHALTGKQHTVILPKQLKQININKINDVISDEFTTDEIDQLLKEVSNPQDSALANSRTENKLNGHMLVLSTKEPMSWAPNIWQFGAEEKSRLLAHAKVPMPSRMKPF